MIASLLVPTIAEADTSIFALFALEDKAFENHFDDGVMQFCLFAISGGFLGGKEALVAVYFLFKALLKLEVWISERLFRLAIILSQKRII